MIGVSRVQQTAGSTGTRFILCTCGTVESSTSNLNALKSDSVCFRFSCFRFDNTYPFKCHQEDIMFFYRHLLLSVSFA